MTSHPRSRAWVAKVARTSSASYPGTSTRGIPNEATTSRIMSNCGVSSSGVSERPALYSTWIASRQVGPGGSKATATAPGRGSRTRYMSIETKPCTAVVTVPALVVSSGGRAKYARNASDIPSRTMRGPERSLTRAARGSRREGPLDHLPGDLAHAGARVHRGALDEGEGFLLGQPTLGDQLGLGLVDNPAGGDLVLGRGRRGREGGHLGVDRPLLPAVRQDRVQRAEELVPAERFHQVGSNAGVASFLDQLPLGEGGEHDHRHLGVPGDLPGCLDPGQAGHLHVQDGEVGAGLLGQPDRLVAPASLPHHLVAGRGEDLLEV